MKRLLSSVSLVAVLPLLACGGSAQTEQGRATDSAPAQVEREVLARAACEPVQSEVLEAAREDFNRTATSGYEWAQVDSVQLFEGVACGSTLEEVVSRLANSQQDIPSFNDGKVLASVDEKGSSFFGTYYSPKGPALLDAANAVGRSMAEGWSAWQDIRCHNCTQSEDTIVLYYPATDRVVVIKVSSGSDS